MGNPVVGESKIPPPSRESQTTLELPSSIPRGVSIYFWNGSIASAQAYWETGDTIVYEQPSGRITIPRTMVARIVHKEDGTVKQITATPPKAPQGPATERKTDLRDLLGGRPAATPPRVEGPPAVSKPAQAEGECAQAPEDFSTAERQVVAPHIVRFKAADRWLLIEIRGLAPGDIQHPRDRESLIHELRLGRKITLANRIPIQSDRFQATVCVDGKDIVTEPSLRRFRTR